MLGAVLTHRMIAWTITAAILAAVIGAGATMLLADTPVELTAASDTATPQATPAPTPTPTPTPADDTAEPRTATPSPPKVDTKSALLDDVNAEQEPSPTQLRVDAIGISDSPIDAVGIEPDGSMEIPTDVSRIGWYEYGPAPGEPEGSAVLTAHIDNRTQGKGVFYDLDALDPGDVVEVGMSDGTSRTFVVHEVRQIPKVELPTGKLFRRDGPARLALITCGGEFDSSSRHYRDNLVVLAKPAD